MARLSLGELTNQLHSTRTAFEKWEEQVGVQTSAAKQQHLDMLADKQRQMQELEVQQQRFMDQALELNQQLQAEKEQEQALRQKLEQVNSQSQKVEQEHRQMQQDVEQRKRNLQATEAELEERRATTEASLGQLRGEVAVFRSSLGLCFDMQEGSDVLRLIFTQISASDPELPFTAGVRAGPDSTFQVCFCSPEVPELSLLSEELTRSNNLSNFVRGLRAAFVASVL